VSGKVLPQIVVEITRIIGLEDTARLISARGGRRIYIPKIIKESHWLSVLLGQEQAESLAGHFGGNVVDIPKSTVLHDQNRNQEIVGLYSDGCSVAKLAVKFDLTERRVRSILGKN
jgi:Mor family transcriptional regulator